MRQLVTHAAPGQLCKHLADVSNEALRKELRLPCDDRTLARVTVLKEEHGQARAGEVR